MLAITREGSVLPNPARERASRSTGQQGGREAQSHVTVVGLTRIHGILTGGVSPILTEGSPNPSSFLDEWHFTSWLWLTPRTALSGGKQPNGADSSLVASALHMARASPGHSDPAQRAAVQRIALEAALDCCLRLDTRAGTLSVAPPATLPKSVRGVQRVPSSRTMSNGESSGWPQLRAPLSLED